MVAKVKFAVLKLANEGKRKVVREGLSKRVLEKIMKTCYRRSYRDVISWKRRFPLMKFFFCPWHEKVR